MLRCALRDCRRAAESVGRAYRSVRFRCDVNQYDAGFSGGFRDWPGPCVNICVGMIRNLAMAAVGLMLAAPAHAAGAMELPDPSGITLFSLGVAGLLIGRHIAGKRGD